MNKTIMLCDERAQGLIRAGFKLYKSRTYVNEKHICENCHRSKYGVTSYLPRKGVGS